MKDKLDKLKKDKHKLDKPKKAEHKLDKPKKAEHKLDKPKKAEHKLNKPKKEEYKLNEDKKNVYRLDKPKKDKHKQPGNQGSIQTASLFLFNQSNVSYTVNVVGIFYNGETIEQATSRFQRDVEIANNIWTINGRSCIRFNITKVIAPGLLGNPDGTPRFAESINPLELQANTGIINQIIEFHKQDITNPNHTIFVVYFKGNAFSNGSIGTGGIQGNSIEFANGNVHGRVIIADRSIKTATNDPTRQFNTLAHEIGHVLFTRLEAGQFTTNDPSPTAPYINAPNKPFDGSPASHNNNIRNTMWPVALEVTNPFMLPIIDEAQCIQARKSPLVIVQNLFMQ
ncbi:hypothetical protein [Peribacillus asahii]|uniref:hypothetical protein n=1 Tax=Peribacillus asahii TaxID=228899 RepID=UPI002079646B|nr:hypothetical protein [Peribacillus asahii]USK87496.1 hypothetical protein LIT35_23325 [Peribacillus asahii]